MQTSSAEISLRVSIANQTLEVLDAASAVLRSYRVSTSRFGLGSEAGSLRTPLGRFRVAEKIGGGAPLGAVFMSRVPIGEIGFGASDDDLVLTRILWLEGMEEHNANTKDRYIYIHGTNHEDALGLPASHGCVRMGNADIAELFELVPEVTPVSIVES